MYIVLKDEIYILEHMYGIPFPPKVVIVLYVLLSKKMSAEDYLLGNHWFGRLFTRPSLYYSHEVFCNITIQC